MYFREQMVDEVLQRITEKFRKQLENGLQNQDLHANYRACGQFLETQSPQRGMHGSIAALRVLATENQQQDIPTIKGLVKYLQKIIKIEQKAGQKNEAKVVSSKNNIVKKAELLYALSFVRSGTISTESFRNQINKELEQVFNGRGWPAFVNSDNKTPKLIPSAYAFFALSKNGYTNLTDATKGFLLSEFESRVNKNTIKVENTTDFATLVLSLFTLVFGDSNPTKQNSRKYRAYLQYLWGSEFNIMEIDVEENIEYPMKSDHFYIRIPFQLYLLAISCKINIRIFTSAKSTRRLKAIYKNVMSDRGFIYPHASGAISARTYSIIYELFSIIKRQARFNLRGYIFYVADQLRTFMSSRPVRIVLYSLLWLFMAITIYLWWCCPDVKIGGLAPPMVMFVIANLLGLSKRR